MNREQKKNQWHIFKTKFIFSNYFFSSLFSISLYPSCSQFLSKSTVMPTEMHTIHIIHIRTTHTITLFELGLCMFGILSLLITVTPSTWNCSENSRYVFWFFISTICTCSNCSVSYLSYSVMLQIKISTTFVEC